MSQSNHAGATETQPARPERGLVRKPSLAFALGCLVVPVLACLFIGAGVTAAIVAVRSCEAYQLALTAAQHDPSVVSELGSPVAAGWLTSGQVNIVGANGDASLAIPISGPRGAGTLNARAEKSAGKWTFSRLDVAIPGRATPVDLLAAP